MTNWLQLCVHNHEVKFPAFFDIIFRKEARGSGPMMSTSIGDSHKSSASGSEPLGGGALPSSPTISSPNLDVDSCTNGDFKISMLPYANWINTDATNVLLSVRIRPGVPFTIRSWSSWRGPRTPNPKRVVRLHQTVNLMGEFSILALGTVCKTVIMWVRFPPRSPMFDFNGSVE